MVLEGAMYIVEGEKASPSYPAVNYTNYMPNLLAKVCPLLQ